MPGFERAEPSNVALPLPNDRLFVEGKYTNRFLLQIACNAGGKVDGGAAGAYMCARAARRFRCPTWPLQARGGGACAPCVP